MKRLRVIQHTSAEYLGLIEDHLEGRRIRFDYTRPFTEDGKIPPSTELMDGLILLGGGPWGSAGARNVPTLDEEIRLARSYLMHDRPIIGIGLGAQILALAAGGKTESTDYRFEAGTQQRVNDDALKGFMPQSWPWITMMRDRFIPPDYAQVLAIDHYDEPSAFQIGDNAFGFSGHPAFKLAMAEDMIMEFEESPEFVGEPMNALRAGKLAIEDALVPLMTGLIQATGWMRSDGS